MNQCLESICIDVATLVYVYRSLAFPQAHVEKLSRISQRSAFGKRQLHLALVNLTRADNPVMTIQGSSTSIPPQLHALLFKYIGGLQPGFALANRQSPSSVILNQVRCRLLHSQSLLSSIFYNIGLGSIYPSSRLQESA